MVADLDDALTRLNRTASALGLKTAAPPVTTPPIMVEVVSLPGPHSWRFQVERDEQGRIAAMVAVPVEP